MAKKSVRLEIRITEEIKEKLEKIAESKGLSIGALVRMIIIEHSDKQEIG